jgi:hypothetical protein
LLAEWRCLGAEPLARRILAIQRLAAERHLPEYVWNRVDAMRDRLKFLQGVDQYLAKARSPRPKQQETRIT